MVLWIRKWPINAFIILLMMLHPTASSGAGSVPAKFTFEGRLFDSAPTPAPLNSNSVKLRIQILNPTKTCVLFEQEINGLDVSNPSFPGWFAVAVGLPLGDPNRGPNDPNPENDFTAVFSNVATPLNGTNGDGVCTGGNYTPAPGDNRYIRIYVEDVANSTPEELLSPDFAHFSVPSSLVAEALQGLIPSDFILKTTNVTPANMETLTGGSDAMALHNHDSTYMKPPGSACSSGDFLTWSGSAASCDTPAAGGITSLNDGNILIGDSGNIPQEKTVSGDATLSNAGVLTIGNNAVTNAKISSVDWSKITGKPATLSGLGSSLNDGKILIGDSGNLPQEQTMSGDATLSNAGVLTIGNNAVTNAKISSVDWSKITGKPATLSGLGSSLNDGKILIGDSGNLPQEQTLSGDATLSNAGVLTIGNNAVTNAKISSVDWSKITGKPATLSGLGSSLNDGKILIGDSGNLPQEQSLSGDATLSNAGVLTINNSAVTDAKISSVDWGKITGKPNTLAGYGISDGVTSISVGTGLTGGPITSTGSIGLGTELAGINSLSNPGFVKRAAGAGSYSTSSSINLASDVSGVLPPANGGTGNTIGAAAGIANSGDANVVADNDNDGNGDVIIRTAGNTRIRVRASDGNVGIGTVTPAEKLDVNGNVKAVNGAFTGEVKADVVQAGPGGATVCDYNIVNGGKMRYNPNTGFMEYCNHLTGTWLALQVVLDISPEPFNFADTSGGAGGLVTSNTIWPWGYQGALAATVSGDGSPQICNDSTGCIWGTTAWVMPGQGIKVRTTAHSTPGNIHYVTVTLGTTSDVWQVTAIAPDTDPDPFFVSDHLKSPLNILTESMPFWIYGINTSVTASVSGDGSPQICNDSLGCPVWSTSVSVDQFNNRLKVRTTSSSASLTTNNVTVTINSASDSWQVTTGNEVNCAGSPAIGDMCSGGTIYAGTFFDGVIYNLMVTPSGCNDSSNPTCSGGYDYLSKIYGSNGFFVGATSNTNGPGNTNLLATGYSDTYAAKYCADMDYGGHNDWYLPSKDELHHLYLNRFAIGGLNGYYLSSTELNSNTFYDENLSSGDYGATWSKTNFGDYIRCMRRY